MKQCTKCKEFKNLECFDKHKLTKDGKQYKCKQCRREWRKKHKEEIKQYHRKWLEEDKGERVQRQKEYREEQKQDGKGYYQRNREKILQYSKKYNKEHREERYQYQKEYWEEQKQLGKGRTERYKQYRKEYYQRNREKILQYSKKYKKEHREERNQYRKKYIKDNKEKLLQRGRKYQKKHKEKRNQYQKKRRITDSKFRVNCLISKGMGSSLRNGHGKQARHWESLVPYNLIQVEKHLKKTLPKGYIWKDFMQGKLHIDHRVPIAIFQFEKPEDLSFQRCWALDNLQLLPAEENRRKHAKLLTPFQGNFSIEVKIQPTKKKRTKNCDK